MSSTQEKKSILIIKRDGNEEVFTSDKIRRAITKAYNAGGINNQALEIDKIVRRVVKSIDKDRITVEEIQDIVEHELMLANPYIAKKYIIYREWRNTERDKRTSMKRTMDGIVSIERNDVNLSNANMSSHTPAGQMMTFASEITKDYAHKYLIGIKYARAHRNGDIHIHDLDYYPTKTTTCVQYDLEDIFERGFHTKNGSIRTPQSILSYATLATIIFQTNQNEQHGGQSIPAFDYFMAKGVLKSFKKQVVKDLIFAGRLDENGKEVAQFKAFAQKKITSIEMSKKQKSDLLALAKKLKVKISDSDLEYLLSHSREQVRKETHQAMEGFIHNLNTMHSRGGNQVVFSSINYGTDTSPEGRMVISELLDATVEGLGKGEVPIFPIQIFKVKDGVSYSEADAQKALKDFDKAMSGKMKFSAPNFDLLLKSCKTTSTSLFPNFLFLDTPYNVNPLWKKNDKNRFKYELATMGCRTRVFENLHGETTSWGRGNLSFTSMNMPRLAIEAKREAEEMWPGSDKHVIENEAKNIFLTSVRTMSESIAEQLYERFQYQRTALACQFPFMMGNNIWKGGKDVSPDQQVGDLLNHGTMGIGFIGGHNAMVAIYGEGHADNKEAYQTLTEAIEVINEVVVKYKKKYNLNYAVLATPAEGLAGRFTRMDREKYGVIPGVNDLEYYVNSFHVDVKRPISALEKIRLEAPFHAITKGGHITYVELDGEAKKNVKSIFTIVKAMNDANIGYGSINHPVDTCRSCGHKGVIYSTCPVCGSEDITRIRRITGYLTGSLETWNSAKQAEERDRVKHC